MADPARWRRFLVLFAGWTLLGVFLAINNYQIEQRVSAEPRGWAYALADGLAFAETWLVLHLGIVELCWRHPIGRGRVLRNVPLHAAAALLAASAHLAVYVPLAELADRSLGHGLAQGPMIHRGAVRTLLPWNLVTYAAICLVANTVSYYRRSRESEAVAARLALQLAEARAGALEAQIQPHFLFNALHSVMVLMHQDVAAASATLARLSDLLRHALATAPTQETSFGEELDFALGYLAIEQVRFRDRLSVDVSVHPATRRASVPRLLLQPLVENAVRHGIAKVAGPGRISIRARAEDDALVIEVADTGPGLAGPRPPDAREGVGLANTRERLRLLYGERARLTIDDRRGAGAVVTVTLPLRLPEAAPVEAGIAV